MKKIRISGMLGKLLLSVLVLASLGITSVFASEKPDDTVLVSGGSVIVEISHTASRSNGYTVNTTISSGNQHGDWSYGESGSFMFSQTISRTGQGRASVTSGSGEYDDGGWKPINSISTAMVRWTWSGTNRANWDLKQ